MRVLVVFAHPVETSYQAALHKVVVENLNAAGHEVDDCDLYAEGFNPVLSREERLNYHDESACTKPVQAYVDRLRNAEALVLNFPVWNYGYPAIMKGYFDRVFLPGVSFQLKDGTLTPNLFNIRKLGAVVTDGGDRLRTFLMGDAPRKVVKRAVRAVIHPLASTRYIALHDINRAGDAKRARFIERVAAEMRRF
ncbi:MAG: NAD(P)H-dependent oxidoreductase [Bauldia sp.]